MGKKSKRIAELEAEVESLKRDLELVKAALATRPITIPPAGPLQIGPSYDPPWITTSIADNAKRSGGSATSVKGPTYFNGHSADTLLLCGKIDSESYHKMKLEEMEA